MVVVFITAKVADFAVLAVMMVYASSIAAFSIKSSNTLSKTRKSLQPSKSVVLANPLIGLSLMHS